MKQSVAQVTLVVDGYDRAIDFFTRKLNFSLIEDTEIPEQKKGWIVIAPQGSTGTRLVLGRASNQEQEKHIGN